MYFSAKRTWEYIDALLSIIAAAPASQREAITSRCDVFVVPDHLTLAGVVAQLSNSSMITILPGAQDTHHEDTGAFTGEVSPAVLAEIGCRIVELGHAERRRLFGETDDSAAKKAAAVARNGMVPLVCIGEVTRPGYMSDQNGSGGGHNVDAKELRAAAEAAAAECRAQIASVLAAVPSDAEVILAYEPVWAIGAAEPASAAHVVEVTRCIRRMDCVRRRPDGSLRILYGGSAGPGLFEKIAASAPKDGEEGEGGVDGLFLGRFAHDPHMFWKTILEVATA